MQLTIPAGSTTATNVQVQTGTVAGTITITFRLTAFSNDVTPTPVPVRTIRVNPTPPVITSLTAARNATGLTVTISGFSSSREIQSASFTFSAAPGSTVQTTELTVPVNAMFAQYFGSAAAAPFGSQFTFTQPFTIQQGSSQSIASITVRLTSLVGPSAPATANLQ